MVNLDLMETAGCGQMPRPTRWSAAGFLHYAAYAGHDEEPPAKCSSRTGRVAYFWQATIAAMTFSVSPGSRTRTVSSPISLAG